MQQAKGSHIFLNELEEDTVGTLVESLIGSGSQDYSASAVLHHVINLISNNNS